MAEKVNFTINLDGNLYTGLADIDKEPQYGKDVKIYDKAALERTA